MTASKVRLLVRAIVVCATSFGLKLDTNQVGAIYLLTEALVQIFIKDNHEPESV